MAVAAEDRALDFPLFHEFQRYLREQLSLDNETALRHARKFIREYWLDADRLAELEEEACAINNKPLQ